MNKVVSKIKKISGKIKVPSDKSISHRAVLLGGLSKKPVLIKNFSIGEDCQNSLKIMKNLGAKVKFITDTSFYISSNKIQKPDCDLFAGNSGTTARLLSGILATQTFTSTITGDISLSKRPMKRIITPLTLMGANISSNNFKLPLNITGSTLNPIEYNSPVSSAQVKSCILLAGLHTKGITTITEPTKSRDHTERMLKYMGANIKENLNSVSISQSSIETDLIDIANDISSAAFFMVAASLIPNSKILIKDVGINPTRSGIIDVMKKMNANISITNKREICNEPVADIEVEYSDLKAITIEGEIIPRLIDELPIIALMATQANGTTIIKNAEELKNKESDRILLVAKILSDIGADITPTNDGFIINGKSELIGDCEINPNHDHRLAMMAFVAGLISRKDILIKEFEWVNTSFPQFLEIMNSICEE